jgi:23S rRNA (cytidine1920-2'-O)/16S rRNA (cytidine1409-2'-O)-methyltransferase
MKRRADERIFDELGLSTLELARALIMEGRALADDRPIQRPGEWIRDDESVRVRGAIDRYASRGAHKLLRALDAFNIDVRGRACLDVGASTGGFTDVLLRAGARHVWAVDVGYNLLDYRLRSDPRVTAMERVNARFLKPEDFPEPMEFGATDVSFISLKAVLPAVFSVLSRDALFVALVKPQFEAARADVGERGVVRKRDVHRGVLRDIVGFLPTVGRRAIGLEYSPIRGPEGNIEFLLLIAPEHNAAEILHENTIDDTITRAYDKFINSRS